MMQMDKGMRIMETDSKMSRSKFGEIRLGRDKSGPYLFFMINQEKGIIILSSIFVKGHGWCIR